MLLPFAATIASMQHRMVPECAKKCNFEILLFSLEIEINVFPKKNTLNCLCGQWRDEKKLIKNLDFSFLGN